MTYLLIILGIVTVPAAISLTPKFRPFLSQSLYKTLVGTALPFLIWDWWATTQGHWSFSLDHTLGIQIAHLPLEEILFFFVAPFACLLIYFAVDRFVSQKQVQLPHALWIVLISFAVILLGLGIDRPYTAVVSFLSLLALVFSWRFVRTSASLATIVYFLCGFCFFVLFNSMLTGIPVVSYATWATVGLRIGTIPIEDFWYNFLLLWLSLVIYQRMTNTKSNAQQVFQSGSTTYYTASRFFSPVIREKVTTLYAFVRVADNYIDQLPEKTQDFQKFVAEYHAELQHSGKARSVVKNFVSLVRETNIKPEWVDAFLNSMIQDTTKKTYANLRELEDYIYGSADVIGLMMARIFGVDPKHDLAARQLGKAMQYCNMLRDIDEDFQLGRVYIPQTVLRRFGLLPFSQEQVCRKPEQFRLLMRQELERCLRWFDQAEEGFVAIPRRERVAVKTATAMYRWTATTIHRNPQLVFQKKLKPNKLRIIMTALYFTLLFG